LTAASLVGSCITSITSGSGAAAAQAVCSKIEGLRMGGLIASGSYGRVYRGDYYGSTVSVLCGNGRDHGLNRHTVLRPCCT
jgi:hypothetical protein